MSKKINFYTVSINRHDDIITNYPVWNFFEQIESKMLGEDIQGQIDRKIGEKWMRIFSFLYSDNRHQIVIPFGKLKDKNIPYWINSENHLEPVPRTLFDLNSLGYDRDYNVIVLTTNREGPNRNDIEQYLNTFIPQSIGLSIKIEPIMHNAGIEKIRNANLVRSVTLNLDLGFTLNNFFNEEIDNYSAKGILEAFKKIADVAKNETESKTLSLTLGLGKKSNKFDTLNLESMMFLLEHINISSDFVKEIIVNYKDDTMSKIDTAKLKNANVLLSYGCSGVSTQISPEELIKNINTAIAEKVIDITRRNKEYFENKECYDAGMFEIVEHWNINELLFA